MVQERRTETSPLVLLSRGDKNQSSGKLLQAEFAGQNPEKEGTMRTKLQKSKWGPVDSLAEYLSIYTEVINLTTEGVCQESLTWTIPNLQQGWEMFAFQSLWRPLWTNFEEESEETQTGSVFTGKANWAPDKGYSRSISSYFIFYLHLWYVGKA